MGCVYLVPPMDDEPPADFVDFVRVRLGDLQQEAARLVGGPAHADEVYPEALADVAGHWRRLSLRRRLTHRDAPADFLARRLSKRAAQWREEQIYQVEVHMLRAPPHHQASVALRKAGLIPGTERRQARPLAEATIAWTHAWRRSHRHSWARAAVICGLTTIAIIQSLPPVPTGF
jgi:hypothetical protein